MDDFEFEVWQDGMPVASASSADRDSALREARHYAAVYGQDGPVEVFQVIRQRVPIGVPAPAASDTSERR